MGQVIHISERLADHSRPSCGGAAFFFALGSPQSYLAGERVERALGEVGWEPLLTDPAALAASRAAAYASDHGRGGRFAVAAARLIFCGSWDVCDPRVIREAAAAAGLDARAALDASQGEVYDLRLHATTRGEIGRAHV